MMTKAVSAAVSTIAQRHWVQVMRWWEALALIGNANSNDDTSSGCTSSNDPCASATAWNR